MKLKILGYLLLGSLIFTVIQCNMNTPKTKIFQGGLYEEVH